MVDLSRTVILSSMLLPPSDAETLQVLPGGSRRLWNVQSGIDFSSLEFCCFFDPGFCMSITRHCWVGESFRVVMGRAQKKGLGVYRFSL